jgi:hypothetical protein
MQLLQAARRRPALKAMVQRYLVGDECFSSWRVAICVEANKGWLASGDNMVKIL